MFQWMMILLEQQGWVRKLFYASSTYTVQGRNAVTFDLLEAADLWDNVLLYDLDQIPPRNITPEQTLLAHLQQISTLPVVGGAVFMRAYPFPPIAYEVANWDGSVQPRHVPLDKMKPLLKVRGLLKVDAVGTGAMLVRKDVLVAMAEHKDFPAHALWETPPRAPADPSAPRKHWLLGEDLNFCREVGELGFDVYMDTEFENGHVEDQIIGSRNYLMAAQAAEQQAQRERLARTAQAQQEGRIWTPKGVPSPTGRMPTS